MVKVVPTNAVAMPDTSSSMRTRSMASRTMRRWSNANSIFSSSTSDTGTSAASAASVPATTAPTSRSTARYATVTTFMRGSRSGSPYAPNWVRRLAASTLVSSDSPLRRLVQGLGRTLEASRNRPHPGVRSPTATHEQHLKQAFGHGQDHDVDGDGERRELRGVVAGWHFRIGSCHYDQYCTRF